MSWLELGWSLLALDRHLTLDRLLRVLLVLGETIDGFVVTCAGRVRRFERPVVLNGWSRLRLGFSMGNRHCFFKDLSV